MASDSAFACARAIPSRSGSSSMLIPSVRQAAHHRVDEHLETVRTVASNEVRGAASKPVTGPLVRAASHRRRSERSRKRIRQRVRPRQ